MGEIIYKNILEDADPLLEQVKPLFSEMYRGMRTQGLMLSLAENGAEAWFEAALSTLGRFGIITAAVEEGKMAGFAHGALKFLPEYLGGHKVGVVTHIFVKPEYRQQYVGKHLLKNLEKWFREKKVHSIELQVIQGNEASAFWKRSGYSLELLQYRKFADENR